MSFRRTYRDTLELVEVSLDYNLTTNCLRFHFTNAAILGGSISIHESAGNVFVLVSTVASVHRLVFAHPNRLQQYVSVDTFFVVLFSSDFIFIDLILYVSAYIEVFC